MAHVGSRTSAKSSAGKGTRSPCRMSSCSRKRASMETARSRAGSVPPASARTRWPRLLQKGGDLARARRPLSRPQGAVLHAGGAPMNLVKPEPIDTEIVRDIAADLRGELDRVEE